MTEDAIQSSRIEGETLARDSVRASARRRLGFEAGPLAPTDIAPATLQPFFAEPTEEDRRKAKALVRAMSRDPTGSRRTGAG
ncbi:hypothetical protein [Azospirillum argentinense]